MTAPDFTQIVWSANEPSSQSEAWDYKRVVVHVDLNSFYTSCEELRSPQLVGKPHAVIMTHEELGYISKGVVASCSYEARKLGVKSAMPLASALKACPDLVLERVDIQYYLTISEIVMNILHDYSDTLEQTSIDEAYLDCSDKIRALTMGTSLSARNGVSTLASRPSSEGEQVYNLGYSHLIEDFARSIKNRIKVECGLLTSVGVAPTKSIAKIASDFRKPDGLTIVGPTEVRNFLENLEVDRISGIGVVTQRSLKQMGINTIGQLARTDVQTLVHRFGNKNGIRMWKIANGLDEDPVHPRGEHNSLSAEYTLPDFTKDQQMLLVYFDALTDELFRRIQKRGYQFRTVGIKLVHADFVVETRERSYQHYQGNRQSISDVLPSLLRKFYSRVPESQEGQVDRDTTEKKTLNSDTELLVDVPIRKIGIRISNMILKRGCGRQKGQLRMPDYF
ncbi:MAG TPA: DNA polymerase IV [Nitrososphaeraceae archaeon]|nr:DNA polymerase IV [Nitrososphaeraceae archaeon]